MDCPSGDQTPSDSNRIGKRGAELVVIVDPDTVSTPDGAAPSLAGAFADLPVGAVTGDVRVINAVHNRLPRLIDERYWSLFEHERAAQSQGPAVRCCSGLFSAYRGLALERVRATT